jgi:hypothetical protein
MVAHHALTGMDRELSAGDRDVIISASFITIHDFARQRRRPVLHDVDRSAHGTEMLPSAVEQPGSGFATMSIMVSNHDAHGQPCCRQGR